MKRTTCEILGTFVEAVEVQWNVWCVSPPEAPLPPPERSTQSMDPPHQRPHTFHGYAPKLCPSAIDLYSGAFGPQQTSCLSRATPTVTFFFDNWGCGTRGRQMRGLAQLFGSNLPLQSTHHSRTRISRHTAESIGPRAHPVRPRTTSLSRDKDTSRWWLGG